jgi:hypothetical protein
MNIAADMGVVADTGLYPSRKIYSTFILHLHVSRFQALKVLGYLVVSIKNYYETICGGSGAGADFHLLQPCIRT